MDGRSKHQRIVACLAAVDLLLKSDGRVGSMGDSCAWPAAAVTSLLQEGIEEGEGMVGPSGSFARLGFRDRTGPDMPTVR